MRASARTTTRRSSSRCATRPMRSPRPRHLTPGRRDAAALRRAVRGQGQYRRRRACRPRPPARPSPIAPAQDATAVPRLRAAGAIVIGKTNLDQFATGLVGMRSPYGMPRKRSTPTSSRADRARARRSRSPPGSCRSRSAPIPRARAGCRRAQQYRRPEAEPRAGLDRGRRAGVPHARLRLGVRADRR